MNPWVTAFVDETGTNDLDADGPSTSHLFICVAIIVDDVSRAVADTGMRQLSAELCGGAEISSRRIGSDHKRRELFLSRVAGLPFGYFALVINKDRIPKDSGLRFKPSFYKYINRMLYERLATGGNNLRIIADQIGGADFMASFRPYLEGFGLPSLFLDCHHSFADSASTPLIQLADLIAGSLTYCFDPRKACPQGVRFRTLLRSREIGVQWWPWETLADAAPSLPRGTPDVLLRSTLRSRVVRFLNEHEASPDLDHQMQAATLSRLFFAREFDDRKSQAIVSDALMARLRDEGFEELSKQAFQSRVIGKLRDAGIILAGSTDGYRLALTVADIQDYLNHDSTIIEPMLARMLKARETVKLDTAGSYDVLEPSPNALLRNLADAFRDYTISVAVTRDPSQSETSQVILPPTPAHPSPRART